MSMKVLRPFLNQDFFFIELLRVPYKSWNLIPYQIYGLYIFSPITLVAFSPSAL